MSAADDRSRRDPGDAPDEPFLSRWSRLKKASRVPASPEAPTAPEAESQPPAVAPADDQNPAAEQAEAVEPEAPELPPLESLTEESDFGPFMRPGVDPELRRLALRKMFRNPKYAQLDPLDPFRADFSTFTPLGDIVTADMKYHAERLLRKQLEEAAQAARVDDPESPGSSDAAATGASAAGPATEAAQAGDAGPEEQPDDTTGDGDERRDS